MRFGFCALALAVCAYSSAGAGEVTFSLSDASGAVHSTQDLRRAKATVLLFVATDCPNSNTYAPALARMYRDFSARGIVFLAVYSDPDDTAAKVASHDSEYKVPYPGLLDPHQTLARQTGARSTPEAIVLSPAGEVLYRGRVDDRFVDFGKTRFQPAHQDLKEALEQVLGGQAVKNPVTKALGCAIPGVD